MTARDLVTSLEERGLQIRWTRGDARLLGNRSKLTLVDLNAIKKHRRELEAIAAWRKLQDDAEAQFGWPGARLYPFAARDSRPWWEAPRICTPLGLAHLVQVQLAAAWVVRHVDVVAWRDSPDPEISARPYSGPSHLLPHGDVWPPSEPPPEAATAKPCTPGFVTRGSRSASKLPNVRSGSTR